MGMYAVPVPPLKHEELLEDGSKRGFATATGKVELASDVLEAMGSTRLPVPAEGYSLCSEDFQKVREEEGWTHLTLITGGRRQP